MILLTSSPSFVSSNSPVESFIQSSHRIDSFRILHVIHNIISFSFLRSTDNPRRFIHRQKNFFSLFLISFPSRHTSLSGATFIPIPAISPFTVILFFFYPAVCLSPGTDSCITQIFIQPNTFHSFYSSGVQVLFSL